MHQHTFALHCGSDVLSLRLTRHLQALGFTHDSTADTWIVFDVPRGFALATLATLAPYPTRLILATGNDCVEYLHDLQDYQPDVLLFQGDLESSLPATLLRVRDGMQSPAPALPPTPLTPFERQIFRLLVLDYSNQQIATLTSHSKQTIKNAVTQIYAKLDLPHRNSAYHYYWGTWQGLQVIPPQSLINPQTRRRCSSS